MADDWQALGYSTTSVERASGQHNRKLLVIVEEASGVEDEIWDAINSLKFVKLLAIGNPLRAEGGFVRLIRKADKDRRDGIPPERACNAVHVSSRESPDADKDESPFGLADKTWIEASERDYGKHSLWVRSHIDAIIPDVSAESLLEERFLDWAAALPARPTSRSITRSTRPGGSRCDLGEGVGRDSSAIIVRDDDGILEVVLGSALGLAQAAYEIDRLSASTKSRTKESHMIRSALVEISLWSCLASASAGPSDTRERSALHPVDFVDLRSEAAWRLRQRTPPRRRRRRPQAPGIPQRLLDTAGAVLAQITLRIEAADLPPGGQEDWAFEQERLGQAAGPLARPGRCVDPEFRVLRHRWPKPNISIAGSSEGR